VHVQCRGEVAAVSLVTELAGHCKQAVCKERPVSGLYVDLPQLLCNPPMQYLWAQTGAATGGLAGGFEGAGDTAQEEI